jgi:hypothetical protein
LASYFMYVRVSLGTYERCGIGGTVRIELSVEVSLFPMSRDVSTIVPIGNIFRKELKNPHFNAFL